MPSLQGFDSWNVELAVDFPKRMEIHYPLSIIVPTFHDQHSAVMLGLGDYGSDSDHDNDESKDTKIQSQAHSSSAKYSINNGPIIKISENSSVSGNQGVKKKKLDISFLPKDIQDALTRGVGNDSDDEDITPTLKNRSQGSDQVKAESKNGGSLRSKLLDMLPKPKGRENESHRSESSEQGMHKEPSQSESKQEKVDVKVADIVDERDKRRMMQSTLNSVNHSEPATTNVEVSAVTSNPIFAWQENSDDESSDNDAEEKEVSIDNNMTDSNLQNVAEDTSSKLTEDSAVKSSTENKMFPVVHAIDPRGYTAADIKMPTSGDQTLSFNNLYNAVDGNAVVGPTLPANPQMHEYHDDANTYSTSSGSKRKRERELEMELLQGNTSVVDSLTMKVVNASAHWNSEAYTSQMQREQELKSVYNLNNPNNVGALQPSKLQNRKHQINSLALKAAETELAMLDAKLNRSRTKAETQGRYGW